MRIIEEVNQSLPKWFGNMERMRDEGLVQRVYVYMMEVNGRRGRKRSQRR